MFERFSDQARRVVVLAQEEARLLHHNYIGTEHVLLGVIHEGEGVAAHALRSLEISLDDARTEIERTIGHGGTVPSGHIPFTPRAKKVLELSLREALELGHDYIGTEHILLGLVREGEGAAAQALRVLAGDLERVRETVCSRCSGAGRESNRLRACRRESSCRQPPRSHRCTAASTARSVVATSGRSTATYVVSQRSSAMTASRVPGRVRAGPRGTTRRGPSTSGVRRRGGDAPHGRRRRAAPLRR